MLHRVTTVRIRLLAVGGSWPLVRAGLTGPFLNVSGLSND
jgi:hypothetical protein